MIHADTMERLEFGRVLSAIGQSAKSPVTDARIRSLSPASPEESENRSAFTEEIRALHRMEIFLSITGFDDIRPLLEQARPSGAILQPLELLCLIPVLSSFAAVSRQFAPRTDIPGLKSIVPPLRPFSDILEPLEASISPEGEIKDTASRDLMEIRKAKRALSARIRKKIEEIIRQNGIELFLQDDFITQRSGRWVIPVRMDSKGMVQGVVHDVSSSGETAFMEPLEIIPFVNELENLTASEKSEEIRILRQLTSWIREDSQEIEGCFSTLVELDMLSCIAMFADLYGMRPASLNNAGILELKGARHPLLLMLAREEEAGSVQPLDMKLGGDASIMVITGPNAGGKTIALKTAGILTLMALSGLPVPADSGSTFPAVDSILVDIGDEQSIQEKLSTFSAHVSRIKGIIASASAASLILLDELGAGTEPLQGAAISCGVLKTLKQKGAVVIATTHLGEIVGFVHATDGMVNAGMEFDNRTFTPLYRLTSGEPGQSHALEIARRYGMPDEVISFAREMIGSGGTEFAGLMSELRQTRVELESERRRLAGLESDLVSRERVLEAKSAEINEARRAAAEKAKKDAGELISNARRDLNRLMDEYRRERRKEVVLSIREREKELNDNIATIAADSGTPEPEPLGEVATGIMVHVRSLGRDALVTSVDSRHKKARVRAGSMELEVPFEKLSAASEQKKAGARQTPLRMDVAEESGGELMLIGERVDEAVGRLEQFINHTSLSGIREVRVIHGIGTGRLRQAIREHLGQHPLVDSFRSGEPHEGRDGATIVRLRQ